MAIILIKPVNFGNYSGLTTQIKGNTRRKKKRVVRGAEEEYVLEDKPPPPTLGESVVLVRDCHNSMISSLTENFYNFYCNLHLSSRRYSVQFNYVKSGED